ncbi:MAG: hypothetical protein HY074_18455 [Deltaproteobacteria bacterium]|nr:hypothetical protein [Deltaproteobacteria bacterium]
MTRLALILLLLTTQNAFAGGAAGMIADLAGDVKWAGHDRPDIMDEVHAGDTLRVGSGSKLVLIYFKGCRKETIAGATEVKVGEAASEVKDQSAITATRTKCEPPGIAANAKVGSVPGALVLMGKKKSGDPEKDYKDAIENNPKDIGARTAYAVFLENRGHFSMALTQYDAMARLQPGSASVAAQRGSLKAAIVLQALTVWSRMRPKDKLTPGVLRAAGVTDSELLKSVHNLKNPVPAFTAAYHGNTQSVERFYRQILDSK